MACSGTSPFARQSTSICSWLSPRLRTSLLTSGSQRATVIRVSEASPISSHSSAWRSASRITLSISSGCIRLSIVTNCRWKEKRPSTQRRLWLIDCVTANSRRRCISSALIQLRSTSIAKATWRLPCEASRTAWARGGSSLLMRQSMLSKSDLM